MQIKGDEMNILVEVPLYPSAFKGKTVVVKYGGNAMLAMTSKTRSSRHCVLRLAGMRPVVVHGGGPEITAMLKQAGKKERIQALGLRVTDAETGGR